CDGGGVSAGGGVRCRCADRNDPLAGVPHAVLRGPRAGDARPARHRSLSRDRSGRRASGRARPRHAGKRRRLLIHGSDTDRPPNRLVVIGMGFVGAAVARAAAGAGIPVLGLTRREVDLLGPDAAAALLARIRPDDSVLFTSAIAPAKTAYQLVENLRMAEQACQAFAKTPPAHLVYISSDAVYADWANPVTEDSPVAPTTLHGMMH